MINNKYIKIIAAVLCFAQIASFSAFAANEKKTDDDEIEAYKNALENYKSLYENEIKKRESDPYSGFHRQYQIAPGEDSFFANATDKDVLFYASLCSLVYTKERADFRKIQEEVLDGLKKMDTSGHKLIGILKRNLSSLPALSAILLYNQEKNHVVLVFKGTVDADNYDDWKKNVSFTRYSGKDPFGALSAPDGSKLSVHGGFARAYLEGLDDFLEQFREILSEYALAITSSKIPLRVTITGHSLGGALSLVAANDMRRILRTSGLVKGIAQFIVENISFAAPRVYDAASARIVERGMGGSHNILRFADIGDLVPTVPWTILYADHAGTPIYFGTSTWGYSIARHSMSDNYLKLAPDAFKKVKDDSEYLRFVLDSIAYYKKLLKDDSVDSIDLVDKINNLKITLAFQESSYDFFKGMLSETKGDAGKQKEIEKYIKDIESAQKSIKENIVSEEKKLGALSGKKSSWWPF